MRSQKKKSPIQTRYSKPLSREKTARAAIDIVRQHGEASLSMRKVAELFDVDVAALYRHFKNKEALLAQIGVLASQELDLDLEESGRWETRFLTLANTIRLRIVSHPELGIHGQTSPRATPFYARANGLIATLFLERGLTGSELLYATQTMLHLITSIAESEASSLKTTSENNRAFATTIADYLPEAARKTWPSVSAEKKLVHRLR